MSEAELEVEVTKAPVGSERALRFQGVDQAYQALADAGTVTFQGGEEALQNGFVKGLVRVLVVEEDAGGKRTLVQLPGEVIMGGRRVWVPKSILRR